LLTGRVLQYFRPAVLGYDPLPEGASLPERLKSYRRRRGLSQRALALELDLDPETLKKVETGRRVVARVWELVEEMLG
jgi:DNA-binding XRE family transcriptional regulator